MAGCSDLRVRHCTWHLGRLCACSAGVPDRTVEIRFRNLVVRGTQVVKAMTDPRLMTRLKVGGRRRESGRALGGGRLCLRAAGMPR